MADGIHDAAVRFFLQYRQETQQREPDFADATILLVKAYLRQGRYAEAGQALDYHAQNSKALNDFHYRDGLKYWRGAVLRDSGKLEEAVAQVKPLAETSQTPEYRNRALELLGDAHARLGQWDQAEQALNQLLAEFPDADNALRARLGLVKVFLAKHDPARAGAALDQTMSQHPNAPATPLKLYRILIYLQSNKLDDALKLYRSIEDERPSKPDVDWWLTSSQLAGKLMAANRNAEALAILPQVTALATTEIERIQSYLRMAEAMIALEKVELAINTLENFKKTYPGRTEVIPVQLKLAELLRKTKSFVTATEYFGDVAGNEKAPIALRYRAELSRGWCFREVGQFENAVQAFARASNLGQTPKEQAEALFYAGDASFHIESFTNAALYYRAVADNYSETEFAEEARLKQARSRAEAKLYSSAAVVYQQFLEEYRQSAFVEVARLERGIALKGAGDFAVAMAELFKVAQDYPKSANAPLALMEAYEAAMGADDIPGAVRMLSEVIDKYSSSEHYPRAVHLRAHVHFFQADYDDAVADCLLFLEKFPLLPMATEILIWLGDHYANSGKLEKSEEYFIRLVNDHPKSVHAPMALYEAAKSAYHREDLPRATSLLQQLAQQYPNAPTKVKAQSQILQGDMFAKEGRYEDAIPHFTQAAELASGSDLGLEAVGRLGEMHYSLGTGDKGRLAQAVECFKQVLENEVVTPKLKEFANYRLGKCYEKQGLSDKAVAVYLDIVYQYSIDIGQSHPKIRDWFYFARAGYDAARLLVLGERYREAARIYERLYSSGIPMAADAKQKADDIRKTHNLGN